MVKLLVVVDVKDMVVVLVNVVGRKVVNSSAGSALLLSDTKGSPDGTQSLLVLAGLPLLSLVVVDIGQTAQRMCPFFLSIKTLNTLKNGNPFIFRFIAEICGKLVTNLRQGLVSSLSILFLEGTPHPQMFSKSFKAHLSNSLGSLLSMSIRLPAWIRTTKSRLCSSKVPWAPSKSTVKCGGDVNAVERLLWPQFEVEFHSNHSTGLLWTFQWIKSWQRGCRRACQGRPGKPWDIFRYLYGFVRFCTLLCGPKASWGQYSPSSLVTLVDRLGTMSECDSMVYLCVRVALLVCCCVSW